jgi:hypothetical protein
LNFAIQIRDNIPPKPVASVAVYDVQHANGDILVSWSKNPEKDVVKYKLYLGDSVTDFNGPRSGFESILQDITLDSIQEDYESYKSIDYLRPNCELAMGLDGTTYCAFDYNAVGTDGQNTKISLLDGTLYYMQSTNTFLYIINGSDKDNVITDGKEKFIAVTAVDVDGNEIDNIQADQKITFGNGKNLVSIAPKDLLEAGFAKITASPAFSIDGNTLILSWNDVNKYIDDTPLSADASSNSASSSASAVGSSSGTVSYKLYLASLSPDNGCLDDNLFALKNMGQSVAAFGKASDNHIDISAYVPGTYCVGVTAIASNGLEFDGLFTKRINLPVRVPLLP